MIFVTVGTARSFERLIKRVDKLGKKYEIIIQRGQTKYTPKNCKYFDFIDRDNFLKYIKKADVVVTHAGVGAIVTSLTNKKPTVIVPRRKIFNEHKNDHQMDITKELEDSKIIVACYDIERLEEKILQAKKIKFYLDDKEKKILEKNLKNFIEGCKK